MKNVKKCWKVCGNVYKTGIVLKYVRSSNNSRVEMKMESISIDGDREEDLYEKYIKSS